MLPLPTSTAGGLHPTPKSMLRPRNAKIILAAAFFSFCMLITYFRPASDPTISIDMAALERILEQGASDAVVTKLSTYDGPGLTPLGPVADESFHLGNTSIEVYQQELEDFVSAAFPESLRGRALASMRAILGPDTTSKFESIPHKYVLEDLPRYAEENC